MSELQDVVEIRSNEENPILTTLALTVTNACNLRCKHCSVSAGGKMEKEISGNELIKAIYNALDLGLIFVPISGGEPLIRKDIMEVLIKMDDASVQTMINTNGLLISERLLKEIIRLKYFGGFSVSLDGARKETHEFLRGKNTFQKTLWNIKLLVESRIGVALTCVLHKLNVKEIEDVIKLAEKLKITVRFIFLAPVGRGGMLKNLIFSPNEKLMVIKKVCEYIVNYKPSIRVYMNIPPALIPPQYLEEVLGTWRFTTGCFIGLSQLHILPNGDVYPCFNFAEYGSKFLLGNIKKDDIKRIWKSSKILKIFRKALYEHELTGVCKKCHFKKACRGYCPAAIFRSYGTLKAPHPLCQTLYQGVYFMKSILNIKNILKEDYCNILHKLARLRNNCIRVFYKSTGENFWMLEYRNGRFAINFYEKFIKGVSLYELHNTNENNRLLKSLSINFSDHKTNNVQDWLFKRWKISTLIVPLNYNYLEGVPRSSKSIDLVKETNWCDRRDLLKCIAKDILSRVNNIKVLYLLLRDTFEVKHILVSQNIDLVLKELFSGLCCGLILKISQKPVVILYSNAYAELVDYKRAQEIIDQIISVSRIQKITSPKNTVVKSAMLSPDTYGTLVHEGIIHHLEADNYAIEFATSQPIKNAAFSDITISDLPDMAGGIKLPFDDEGIEKENVILVNKGIITGKLHNTITASESGEKPTGNGRVEKFYHLPLPRQTNIFIQSGSSTSLSSIIEDIKEGFYITNAYKGLWDYNKNFEIYCCGAFLIKDGEITKEFVPDLKLIGNTNTMFNNTLMCSKERATQMHFFMGCNKHGQQVPISISSPYALMNSLKLQYANYALNHILTMKNQIKFNIREQN